MGLISIDGIVLRRMMICGANGLTRNSRELDALNVFPVPDGDTGVNMANTVQAAAREAEKLNTPNIHDIAKAASNGALRGARGNSGVILSQLFRGFAKGLEGKSVATASDLARALTESARMAYRAVMKPKEGTILTIARVIGEYAKKTKEKDIETALSKVIESAAEVLEQTPDMLPELKRAGVVDSGGKGLIYFYQGVLEGLASGENRAVETLENSVGHTEHAGAYISEDIKFGYCTELLIETKEPIKARTQEALTRFLSSHGDSIVVVADDNIVKVHVHTNNPGLVLERGLTIGSLTNIKIDNMREQHNNLQEYTTSHTAMPKKDTGFVAVAAGRGFSTLFKDMGADYVIEGGQTMNPSAEDIVKSISAVNADKVIVLPNNKNIVLAAEQAAKLSDKEVYVIPTKSIPQGLSCLINYLDDSDINSYLGEIGEKIAAVHTGQITYAVRDTNVGGKVITQGDILCLFDGEIVRAEKDIQEGSKQLLDYMIKETDGEFVSIYYGKDTTADMANELSEYVSALNPSIETEIYGGGQPLYYYIFSVE